MLFRWFIRRFRGYAAGRRLERQEWWESVPEKLSISANRAAEPRKSQDRRLDPDFRPTRRDHFGPVTKQKAPSETRPLQTQDRMIYFGIGLNVNALTSTVLVTVRISFSESLAFVLASAEP